MEAAAFLPYWRHPAANRGYSQMEYFNSQSEVLALLP
jgi:hypothetical protein